MPYKGIPDNGDQSDLSDGEDVLSYLADKYAEGIVTDNNTSATNKLTGIEQAIAFHYDIDPFTDEGFIKVNDIRREVLDRYHGNFKKMGYATASEQNLDYSRLKLGIYEKGDEILLQEFVSDYYGDERFLAWVDQLARGVVNGLLTEDNPSYRGLTGLDQVIILGCDLEPLSNDRDRVIVQVIKSKVRSRVSGYLGGTSLNRDSKGFL